MLRSDLIDLSDAYIAVKGTINVADSNNDAYDTMLVLKNNAPFTSCVSKINNTLIHNAEDLHVVMPMYNLLEYSKNYSKTTGRFRNYCRDETNSGAGGENNNTEIGVEIVVPLKHLSNFWRTLNILLINCEINLILTQSKNCLLTQRKATRDADPDVGHVVAAIENPANATFKITDTKLHVSVVTLSTGNDKNLLEQLRQDLKELLNRINICQKRLIRLKITT